jgi:hypothetical protein
MSCPVLSCLYDPPVLYTLAADPDLSDPPVLGLHPGLGSSCPRISCLYDPPVLYILAADPTVLGLRPDL